MAKVKGTTDFDYVIPVSVTKIRKVSVETEPTTDKDSCDVDFLQKMLNSIGNDDDKATMQMATQWYLRKIDHKFRGMLWYRDGEILLIEVPNKPHEIAQKILGNYFVLLKDNDWMIPTGTNRWVGADNIGREADCSYQPDPTISAPPPGVNVQDYVTLIIEVGYSQNLGGALGMRAKAQQWLNVYPSVAYVVLVHISKRCAVFKAEVWERNAHDPTQVRNFSHGVHSITLNIRPILGLPAGAVLPVGCPATVVINLARVRNRVMAVPL